MVVKTNWILSLGVSTNASNNIIYVILYQIWNCFSNFFFLPLLYASFDLNGCDGVLILPLSRALKANETKEFAISLIDCGHFVLFVYKLMGSCSGWKPIQIRFVYYQIWNCCCRQQSVKINKLSGLKEYWVEYMSVSIQILLITCWFDAFLDSLSDQCYSIQDEVLQQRWSCFLVVVVFESYHVIEQT